MSFISQFEFVGEQTKGDSASATTFFTIRDRKTKKEYFVKLFVESVKGKPPYSYALLKHELDVYHKLYRDLKPYNIRNILFPHRTVQDLSYKELVEFVSEKMTENQAKKYVKNCTKEMLGKHMKVPAQNIPSITYMGSISDKVVYDKFRNFTEFLSDTKKYWTRRKLSRYMAILVLTLYQMSNIGVNQNDLHFGNIMVSQRRYGSTPFHCQRYLIVTPKDTFIVDNEYTLLVFDFDRAAIRNEYISELSRAEHGGNCPSFHEKRDLLRVICVLFQHIYHLIATHSEVFDFQQLMLDSLVRDPYIRDRIKNAFDTCWLEYRYRTPDGEVVTSISCIDEWLTNGLASVSEILTFFFRHAKFKRVPTKKLIQNDASAIQLVTKELAKDYLWTLDHSQLINDADLEKFITANIQYTRLLSATDKNSLVENISSGFRKTIQQSHKQFE
jgi:hypothetical protein